MHFTANYITDNFNSIFFKSLGFDEKFCINNINVIVVRRDRPCLPISWQMPTINLACRSGNTKLIRLLLKHNAEPYILDKRGRSALDIAIQAHQK